MVTEPQTANQLDRIKRMEENLDAAAGAVRALESALEAYTSARPRMEELFTYYQSAQWLRDYDDDCAGKLPGDLKRGVLSQDAVYDLLTDHQRLLNVMREWAETPVE